MAPTWRRDPIDRRPLMPVLDELAVRRGEAYVAAALERWLAQRRVPHLTNDAPAGSLWIRDSPAPRQTAPHHEVPYQQGDPDDHRHYAQRC